VGDWNWVEGFLLALILLNVLAVILKAVYRLQLRFSKASLVWSIF
jgi:hypothetical protein